MPGFFSGSVGQIPDSQELVPPPYQVMGVIRWNLATAPARADLKFKSCKLGSVRLYFSLMSNLRFFSALLAWATLAAAVPLFSVPAAMPLISQGVPAYASDRSNQAGLANNANYDDSWRSFRTPSVVQPAWLAYDLSAKYPGPVVVTWYNNAYDYNYVLRNGSTYNLFKDYTIEVNAAVGGTVPTAGWVTKLTVTGNEYHSRTALVDMTGYNWIRIQCTAIAGSASNFDASGNLDVFDARNGAQDTWLFLGDSITAGGMVQSGTTFAQSVNSGKAAYFPSQENGGMAGWTTANMLASLNQFLADTLAHYVTLSLGTNDVNTYAGDTTAVNNAYANLVAMANAVLAVGRVPVIPHVPWARGASLQANAPALNAKIDTLCAENPSIILGPDLYGYFNSNQSLIGTDNLHPTNAGYQAYRNYWAQWALAKIYTTSTSAPVFTTQPVGQAVAVGTSITLSASANGTPAPAYQWQKDGVAISSATANTYTITSPGPSDSGTYTLVATNSTGSVTSAGALLTVIVAPSYATITITVE